MSVVTAIRKMLAAGMDLETALIAAEAFEAEVEILTPRQARNRRYYEAKRLKSSESRLTKTPEQASETRLKASESVLNQTPLARVRDNPSRLVISGQTVVDVSASALDQPNDWPAERPVEALVSEVASPRLDPAKSQGLIQTSGMLAAWRRAGASWEFDVVPTVKALCAKASGPVKTWKYFDAAIGQSIADNRRALEIPEASPTRATGPPTTFAAQIGADNAEARRLAFARMDAKNG